MIRPAKPGDLETLTDMMMRFTDESGFKLTYDREQIRELAWRTIHSDDAILLVGEKDGILTSMVCGVVDAEFSIEPLAYINKFYVDKPYRGRTISRELIQAFDKECLKHGVALSFASSTADMGERNEKLFVHLFKKSGYGELGRIVVKDLRD